MKRTLALACAVLTLANPQLIADGIASQVIEAEQQRIEAIAKGSSSTVAIFAAGDSNGGGSGVVITPDGYTITNYHVADPCGTHMKCSMNDGNLYDAVIVAIDPVGDVAMIKLLGRDDFPTATIADSESVRVGDWCFAVGNPFLLATNFQPTVSYGIVSGVHRYQYPAGTLLEYTDCIQTDAAINPGNSGGPLFNANGDLIGINGRGSFEKRGRVNVGVGYAISINQVQNFLGHLRSGRILDHATLGATVSTDDDSRVIVTNILASSDAYRRGLRYGDEIVSFGGRTISTVNGFKNVLGIFPKGWRVPLSYRRGEIRRDILVRLDGVHTEEELIARLERSPMKQQERPAPPKDPRRPGDDDAPKDAPPNPHKDSDAKKELPEFIAKLYQKKRGFSNYYFNTLARDETWKQFEDICLDKSLPQSWEIIGDIDSGGKLQFTATENAVSCRWNEQFYSIDFDDALESQLAPRNSGGAMLALASWHRLLSLGPKSYGDVVYLGKAPIYDQELSDKRIADVFVATFDVIETRFYFDSETSELSLLEMYPDTEVDPCEIRFLNYRKRRDGRRWPSEISIKHGDTDIDSILLDKFTITSNVIPDTPDNGAKDLDTD